MARMDNLDDILRKRSVPAMPEGLAHRIIATARPELFAGEALRKEKRRCWLEALFDGVLLPQPTLALSLFLLVGVIVGSYTDVPALNAPQGDVAAYFSISEDDGYGDWL